MADEMKELRGAVFDLIPDGVSVVALDEIEVDDMAPKTRNVKDEDSNKQHRVDDERFGGLVYKLPGVAVRDCRRKRIRDKVSVFVRQRPSAAIPEMTQLRLTGRVLLSPYAWTTWDSPSSPTAWSLRPLAPTQEGTPMNEAGISIPWWGWLALIAALVACAIVAKIARDIRATKNIIAARTKNTQQVEDEDRKLVRYGKRLGGHYIAWPREWCNQEEAAGRGAMTVNELCPDETAEPIAHRRFTWVQRTRRM